MDVTHSGVQLGQTHGATETRQPVKTLGIWRRAVTAGGIGNGIEFYDATIYSLLAPIFSPHFFPSKNPAVSLLYTYGIVVGASFIVRPIAAILLSPYGDKFGRRRLLSLTLFIMGGGLLLIGLTPTYHAIGWAAPFLFTIGRIVQNISNSGEYQAASAFVVEHAPPDRRASVGSVQYVTAGIGILAATMMATLVTSTIPKHALNLWGWRLPFIIGALLCLFGVYLRRRAPESPMFRKLEASGNIERKPVRTALREHRMALLLVVVIQFSQVTYFTWQVFLPTYAHLVAGMPLSRGLALNMISLATFVLLLPVVGMISDRVTGRKPLLIAEATGFAVLAYPLFRLLQHAGTGTYLFVSIVGNLLLALTYANAAALFSELFPTEVRTSGIGIPYNLATTAFGGSAPLIATWSIANHHPMTLAFYIMALEALAALLFLFLLPETRGRTLS